MGKDTSEYMKEHVFELRRKKWRHDWSFHGIPFRPEFFSGFKFHSFFSRVHTCDDQPCLQKLWVKCFFFYLGYLPHPFPTYFTCNMSRKEWSLLILAMTFHVLWIDVFKIIFLKLYFFTSVYWWLLIEKKKIRFSFRKTKTFRCKYDLPVEFHFQVF